jgi:hypothetical protein
MEPMRRPSRISRLRRVLASLFAGPVSGPYVPRLHEYPTAARHRGR